MMHPAAPLIKHCYNRNLKKVAREIQKIPCVVINEDIKKGTRNFNINNFPWIECLLVYTDNESTSYTAICKTEIDLLIIVYPFVILEGKELIHGHPINISLSNNSIGIIAYELKKKCGKINCATCNNYEENLKEIVSFYLPVIHKIINPTFQPVEVIPANPRVTKKTTKKKPWLRDDMPHIIYMDPNKPPKEAMPSQGGTHDSPRRHERRGHWRTLRDPKYYKTAVDDTLKRIWVRPCWVGEKEWQYKGNIYRIIEQSRECV